MMANCNGYTAPLTWYMWLYGGAWYNNSYSGSGSGTTTAYPPFMASGGYASGAAAGNTNVGLSLDPPPPMAMFQANLNQNTCGNFKGQATSGHTAVVIVGMGDGSVRNLSQGLSQYSYSLALIPNDGLPLGSDW
jgi:hypothetical protein